MLRIALLILFAGCERGSVERTIDEIEPIIGEKVKCLQITTKEGFICRSVSGRNYICPRDAQIACFFTTRIQLTDIPAEKPKE